MKSHKWFIQIEKQGEILQIRGKPYFEKECNINELLTSAKKYIENETISTKDNPKYM